MKSLKLLLLSLPLLLLCSCFNTLEPENSSVDSSKAYISFTFNDDRSSRTLKPSVNMADFSNLVLKGMPSNGNYPADYEQIASADSIAALSSQVIELTPGGWSFHLTARYNGIPFAADSFNNTINTGSNNTVNFNLASLFEYGNISITVDFQGDANSVEVYLEEPDYNINSYYVYNGYENPVKVFHSSDFTNTAHGKSVTFNQQKSGGTYKLVFAFFHDDVFLNYCMSYVRVVNGFTTSDTITLDLNGIYTLEYEFNGGQLANTPQTLPTSYSRYSIQFGSIALPTMQKQGWEFKGWYTTADFQNGTLVNSSNPMPLGTTKLYACYFRLVATVSPNGTNLGDEVSTEKPVRSIQDAIAQIDSMDEELRHKDWTILINGTITGRQYVGASYDSTKHTVLPLTHSPYEGIRSITIEGFHDPDENGNPVDVLNGGSPTDEYFTTLTINTSNTYTNELGTPMPVTIRNLKITGGNNGSATCVSSSAKAGAGLYIGGYSSATSISTNGSTKTKVTLDNVLITGNTTSNFGGGMYVNSRSIAILKNHTKIDNNTAIYGGGAYIATYGELYILKDSGCVISNNSGNGVYSKGGIFHMQGGTISGNTYSNSSTNGKGYACESGYNEYNPKIYVSGDATFSEDNDIRCVLPLLVGGEITSEKVGNINMYSEYISNDQQIIQINADKDPDDNTLPQMTLAEASHKFGLYISYNSNIEPNEHYVLTEQGLMDYWLSIGPIYVSQNGNDVMGQGVGTIDNPYKTIGEAIRLYRLYNGSTGSDDFTIKVMGTLVGNQVLSLDVGHGITIEGANGLDENGNPQDCLDGNHSGRTLLIYCKTPVTIKNLKITGGYDIHSPGLRVGWGTEDNANVTLENGVLITGNESQPIEDGTTNGNNGGLFVSAISTVTIKEGARIKNNHATRHGGGVYIAAGSTVNMLGGSITGNTADMYGGGVLAKGTFIMQGGTISGNTATKGGGVYKYTDGVFTKSGGTITGNTATEGGDINDTATGDVP